MLAQALIREKCARHDAITQAAQVAHAAVPTFHRPCTTNMHDVSKACSISISIQSIYICMLAYQCILVVYANYETFTSCVCSPN